MVYLFEIQQSVVRYVFGTLILLAVSILIWNFVVDPDTHQAVWDAVNRPLVDKYNDLTLEDGTLRTDALNRLWEDI